MGYTQELILGRRLYGNVGLTVFVGPDGNVYVSPTNRMVSNWACERALQINDSSEHDPVTVKKILYQDSE